MLCNVCNSTRTRDIFQLNDLPAQANVPQPSREEALLVRRASIRLRFCSECGHLFNASFDPDLISYQPGYENSLEFSPRFESYLGELAAMLVERHNLRSKKIIEVACGRGSFLKLLCKLGGNRGVGIDPSRLDDVEQNDLPITFLRQPFVEAANSLDADFICCRHALEHFEKPHAFLRSVRRSLVAKQSPVVFFEVPNSLFNLKEIGIWELLYEHCSYFSRQSLHRVFDLAGYRVLEIYEGFGRQFLCVEARPHNNTHGHADETAADRQMLNNTVVAIEQKCHRTVTEWNTKLSELQARGKRTVIWGAGAKGITFLNALEAATKIAFAVDVNPRKHGRFVAGSGQRIVPPRFLTDHRPDCVIVMNANYEEEIRTTLAELDVAAEVIVAD